MKNQSNQYWDLIGDIHGELDALTLLLTKLGYREEGGIIAHPAGRKLIFVGDLIDRGPESRGVLRLVRRLIDSGQALAVMGNHEYNFIANQSRDDEGKRLRLNTPGHRAQVEQTLKSFEYHEEEIPDWIEWMKRLPFFLDLGDLRVVHASWVPGDIAYLTEKSLLDRDFLIESTRRGSSAWEAIGRVLKGVEIEMPCGIRVTDANGISRKSMRVRWWGELAGLTWKEIAFPSGSQSPEGAADLSGLDAILAYGPAEPPVFFGHYKLKRHPIGPQAPNVATLDYGLGHGGCAIAYRWSGESVIKPENFIELPIYELFIDDNSRYMDEHARRLSGRYFDYEAALEEAIRIVNRSISESYRPGMSAEELEGNYRQYGDDPFIIPTPGGRQRFSAWTYAGERARMIAESEGPSSAVSGM